MYVKDSSAILATNVVCSIKDKFNYLLLGAFSGMSNVVVYDLGMKIYSITTAPASIVSTVMFPRSAKNRNVRQFNKILMYIVLMNIVIIAAVNIIMPFIVDFFLNKEIDMMPLRLFSLAPLFSTTSAFIIQNMCIAYGYNKYALYSILVTTATYISILVVFYFTHFLSSIYAFVLLAVFSYFVEFIYRFIVYRKIYKKEKNNYYMKHP